MININPPRVRFLDRNCPDPGMIREANATRIIVVDVFVVVSGFAMDVYFYLGNLINGG